MAKKLNKKALLGIGAGVLATVVGAVCLFKKKDNEDYVESDVCYDDEAEAEDEVESEE